MASGAFIPRSESAPDGDHILQVLQDIFHFPAFRPGQETVCRAALEGRDVLVVMPTGSGKSLCFQLPTLARGGTALVISPLIALMEDQVAKLNALGLRADRIHSGRGRENSRETALAFRDRKLQFLFIAPERLAVPGFPEFLARGKPSLIAVDEAHCISQWGHDFRPDYRMLRRYLPLLRPAPLVALTATATPIVQSDICEQLGLENPLKSIHGFRRDNIAIEVVEVAPGNRRQSVCELLQDPACRPAIVYAPTRSETDALTAELNADFRAEAYHAGLTTEVRSAVQEQFLRGDIEVMVATIAFGMGIDKPDVRTVIHTALPGSMEAYYQEIGRAGRDGGASRAVLMHSYADRHRHDFFFNRDYPDHSVLRQIYRLLGDRPVPKTQLQKKAGMEADAFDKALEKLWIHSGASIDPEENVKRGSEAWQDSYVSQGEQRASQLELMLRYASGHRCRMAALIEYFGDRTDKKTWCGVCDFCAPESCLAQAFRDATADEELTAQQVLRALTGGICKSTGKLFAELGARPSLDRDSFEELLGAMARAGLLILADAVFEKDGKPIPYRTGRLTREGQASGEEGLSLKPRRRVESHKAQRSVRVSKTKPSRSHQKATVFSDQSGESLVRDLKQWRLREAKREKIPAFRILSDRVVGQIAEGAPVDAKALLAISGVGARCVERYGKAILEVVGRHRAGSGR